MYKNSNDTSAGWADWQVVIAMLLFVIFMRCSVYFDSKLLEVVSFIPALYGVVRTFSKLK